MRGFVSYKKNRVCVHGALHVDVAKSSNYLHCGLATNFPN